MVWTQAWCTFHGNYLNDLPPKTGTCEAEKLKEGHYLLSLNDGCCKPAIARSGIVLIAVLFPLFQLKLAMLQKTCTHFKQLKTLTRLYSQMLLEIYWWQEIRKLLWHKYSTGNLCLCVSNRHKYFLLMRHLMLIVLLEGYMYYFPYQ